MEVEENDKLEEFDTMQIINDIVEDIIQPVLESKSKESFSKSSELSAEYKFKSFPLITKDYRSYKFQHNKEQYLKGCKWSPDGTCLLTSCVDKKLRIYDTPKECFSTKSWNSNSQLPELSTSLKVQEGGLVYDFDWFPLMSSWDPISCCFLTTASEEPVHLWDAFTGELRASYRSYNYADEISNAYSVTFNSSGERLYCGFKDSIRIFDTAIPGKKSTCIKIKEVTGQLGIVSCIAFNASSTDYAVGTYAKEIGVYSEKSGTGTCVFQGHGGGITHLMFSPDGNRLYSGSRRDSEIVCWDVRNPGAVLFSMLRSVNTQQRIYFDLTPDGSLLVTGNTDGRVSIFNVTGAVSNPNTPFETQLYFNAHKDCCNGVSINPVCPVLATTSGQRHIPQVMSESDESEDDFQPVGDEGDIFVKNPTKTNTKKLFNYNYLKRNVEDCVKLWWVGDMVSTRTDV